MNNNKTLLCEALKSAIIKTIEKTIGKADFWQHLDTNDEIEKLKSELFEVLKNAKITD